MFHEMLFDLGGKVGSKCKSRLQMMSVVHKYTKWILALVILCTVGAVYVRAAHKQQDMKMVATMTAKMKTVCVGRFLIDIPEEARVELRHSRIHGFDIAAFDEPTEEFQFRLARREAEIKTKTDRLGGNENLESATEVKTDNGIAGKIFVHTRTVTEGTRARGLELERYRYEGVAVEALVHGNGVSIDLATDDYDPDRVANMSTLVAKLVPNPANKVPAAPGFCVDQAYFRDPLKADQREQIMMFAGLPSRPDIRFMLIVSAGVKPDEEGLLERNSAAIGRLTPFERMRVTKLRAGARVIAGLAGEEVITGVSEENDAEVYSFWWEVNGNEDNVLVPHLLFKMNTGHANKGPVPTTLSEGAVVGLWDKISSSIRPRPTAFSKSLPVAGPQASNSTNPALDAGRK